jgi:hypothetical protein
MRHRHHTALTMPLARKNFLPRHPAENPSRAALSEGMKKNDKKGKKHRFLFCYTK